MCTRVNACLTLILEQNRELLYHRQKGICMSPYLSLVFQRPPCDGVDNVAHIAKNKFVLSLLWELETYMKWK